MRTVLSSAVASALLCLLAFASCADTPAENNDALAENGGESVSTKSDELYVLSTTVWADKRIPVCWETPGFATEKEWVRDAIYASWEATADVTFVGWGQCTMVTPGLRVALADGVGVTHGLGTQLNFMPHSVHLNTWQTLSCDPTFSRERCVRATAVHEFGHALGFAHEQNRPDTDGACTRPPVGSNGDTMVGAWDLNSVMNYCALSYSNNARLTATDMAGIRKFYNWTASDTYLENDFDGDGKYDPTIFRPLTTGAAQWFIKRSTGGPDLFMTLGSGTDVPVPAKYESSLKANIAVFKPTTGQWLIKPLAGGAPTTVTFGSESDRPLPADYDGDGRADIALFRRTNNLWFIKPSTGGPDIVIAFGVDSDIQVPADYDGDGKADVAVFRPSEGNWYVKRSMGGPDLFIPFGRAGDVPVPGDYDGDHKADVAIFRPSEGNWYVKRSTGGPDLFIPFGNANDRVVPGDYDGDHRVDVAIFRPSDGNWYVKRSTGGPDLVTPFGVASDGAL